MLSLYNSLGLDGGSVSTGNKLLAVGNDVRGSFPQYDRTTLRIDIDPNEQDLDQSRADVNQDGIVDGGDLTTLLNDFGRPTGAANNRRSDIDESGSVDGADLSLLLTNWGRKFNVGDLGVATGSYDERPDLGVRPSRPDDDGRPKPKPSDFGVATGSYDERPDLGVRPSRPDGEDDGGGEEPNPLVGIVQTINGLVYPTSRVNVKTSPALPAWIKERNV